MRRIAGIFLVIGCGVELRAQLNGGDAIEPLTSDRPGFSDGVNVLPAGMLQLESGLTLSGASGETSVDRTALFGSPLVRLGIGHRLEIRFGGDGFRRDSHREGLLSVGVTGASDFSAGMKIRLISEHGIRPEFALISMTSIPMGNRNFTSAGVDPVVKLAWSKTLGESTSVAGNFSIASLSDSGDRYAQKAVSLQLSRAIWGKWGAFGEAYMVTPVSRDGDRVWTFDVGASHPLGANAQVDISAGQQIVPFARSWFVSAGIVVRRPLRRARRT